MYSHTLRAASSTGLGFALGRIGGRRGGGGAAAPGLVVPAAGAARGRSVSATPAAEAPVPGDQGVAMEQPKQQQPQVPQQDAGGKSKRDDMHKTTGDVMTHSFGEGYSTRSDEEGFGGVYGRNDPVEHPGTEIHPSHPEYDTTQGSEVKEKEKARHLKDEKHAT
ncbi:hypothetical protein GQ55_9G105300 [Panicum hallii var. hallii]|uniref:Uncharacterized protein n=2 Tax=Panicum hallii TaxID=206008 RepID=A0A2T7C1P6_9POAL|nr:uncharacterized protein LOC112875107 [Panicum hallii]PAN45294.1 hypothetical protein PAHAL_9G108100 [Panicum hallii]PUZ37270.1 hypothetical protein GQ55_9G105300 [Panicum hallii var. hallii]